MEKVKKVKLRTLTRYFETICTEEIDTIDSFSTKLFRLVNQVKSHGETLEEERVVKKIKMFASKI